MLDMNVRARCLFPASLALLLVTRGALAAPRALPAGCDPATPDTCLYISDLHYGVGVVEGIGLVDPARADYPIPLRVHHPAGAVGARPVVIWNHGGLPSPRGDTRSEEWGQALAAAGYVVIHPSRVPVADPSPYQSECADNGFHDPDECAAWLAEMRFGALTTRFLLSNFAQLVTQAPVLAGMLDERKIVVAGHSAGTATVMAIAGAKQRWRPAGPVYQERDERPLAFLATGPQGPTYAGFNAGLGSGSFLEVERPFMFITGVGDETGEPSESRTTGWLTSLPGNKVLSWDTSPEAVHETMDIHKCTGATRTQHCAWIASAGIAFLDAIVRKRPEARDWIASDALWVLSTGAIEIHRR